METAPQCGAEAKLRHGLKDDDDDDDDEITYFTVRWKTRKLVLSTAPTMLFVKLKFQSKVQMHYKIYADVKTHTCAYLNTDVIQTNISFQRPVIGALLQSDRVISWLMYQSISHLFKVYR